MNLTTIVTLLPVFFELVDQTNLTNHAHPILTIQSPDSSAPPYKRTITISKTTTKPLSGTRLTLNSKSPDVAFNIQLAPNTVVNIKPRRLNDRSMKVIKGSDDLNAINSIGSPQNLKLVAEGVPVLGSQKPVTIVGRHGDIFVNKVPKYFADEDFKDGIINIRAINGNVYVNGSLILKKNPRNSDDFYSIQNLNFNRVAHFELTIYPNGKMEYSDDTDKFVRVNYFNQPKY